MEIIAVGQVKTHQVQNIRDDRSYDETISTVSGGMAAMTGNKEMKTVQIVRLDKNIAWVLDPSKKSFTELSFSDMKQELDMAGKAGKEKEPMGEYEWTNNISKDIGTETIMDCKCKGIRAVSIGVKKDDPKDSMFITNEQWFCDDLPGGKEFLAFSKKMADSMGVEEGFLGQMSMNPMLAKFGDVFTEIAKEFATIKGVPLKTVLTVEGTVNPMNAAMGGQEMNDETKAMMEKMGMSVPKANSDSGHYNLVNMTNTVSKVENKSVEDSKYEIPEGYKQR